MRMKGELAGNYPWKRPEMPRKKSLVRPKEVFHEEHKAFAKGKPISNRSILSKLNPKLDEQGIICSDSRLSYTEYLPYDVRFPVILPRGHWTTMLVVKYYHELAKSHRWYQLCTIPD